MDRKNDKEDKNDTSKKVPWIEIGVAIVAFIAGAIFWDGLTKVQDKIDDIESNKFVTLSERLSRIEGALNGVVKTTEATQYTKNKIHTALVASIPTLNANNEWEMTLKILDADSGVTATYKIPLKNKNDHTVIDQLKILVNKTDTGALSFSELNTYSKVLAQDTLSSSHINLDASYAIMTDANIISAINSTFGKPIATSAFILSNSNSNWQEYSNFLESPAKPTLYPIFH